MVSRIPCGRRYRASGDMTGGIRDLRSGMGLSQEKLALKADLDRTYLAGVEMEKEIFLFAAWKR